MNQSRYTQMYKIFFSQRVIYLTRPVEKIPNVKLDAVLQYSNNTELAKFISRFLDDEGIKIANICNDDLELLMSNFRECFKNIDAAGGVVWNSDFSRMLAIKRLGYFDLPKGKVENGETFEEAAVREVSEECGLTGLSLTRHLITTFHTYSLHNKPVLKETRWFEMKYSGSQQPTPCVDEDIVSAFWVNPDEIGQFIPNTYPSIVDVLDKAIIAKGDGAL